jgi:hypothetical protein
MLLSGADNMKRSGGGEMAQKLFWRMSRKLATITASTPQLAEINMCWGGVKFGKWPIDVSAL